MKKISTPIFIAAILVLVGLIDIRSQNKLPAEDRKPIGPYMIAAGAMMIVVTLLTKITQ